MRSVCLALLMLWAAFGASAQTVVQKFVALSSGAGTVSDLDLAQPTAQGSLLIAMPLLLTPDITVESVTDNAPGGGNVYTRVPESNSSCQKQSLDIWYCENCKAGAIELKFHHSSPVRASMNAFIEVSGAALSSVLDGLGVHVSDGTGASDGSLLGPKISTSAKDFVVARYFSMPVLPGGVTPSNWTHTPAFVYAVDLPAGTYQPTLTGAAPSTNFCMSMAAFKVAEPVPVIPPRNESADISH
jgi:hypothetical protein